MARTLSANAFKAMFAQETGEVFLICLTLSHPNWAQPLRVVYNNQPITRAAGVFSPAVFQIMLPDEAPDKVPTVSLTIDNVDRAVTDLIRQVLGPRITVVMEVVLASSPNTGEAGPWTFQVVSCTYDAQSVVATLGLEEDILNSEFPSVRYTP